MNRKRRLPKILRRMPQAVREGQWVLVRKVARSPKSNAVVEGGFLPKPPYYVLVAGCCDCGLVHFFQFKALRGKLYLRAFRDLAATEAERQRRREGEPS